MKKIILSVILIFTYCVLNAQSFDSLKDVSKFVNDSIIRRTDKINAATLNKAYVGVIRFIPMIGIDTAEITTPYKGQSFFQIKDNTKYTYNGHWIKDVPGGGGGGLTDPLTTNGDVIARISGSTTRKPQGSSGTYLGVRAGALDYYSPSDAELSTSDITTNNVSTSKHGLVPKAPNDVTKFLDGTGAYSVPVIGYITATAPNTANCTVPSGRKVFVTLADLTGQANRNVILPSSPVSGDEAVFKNINTPASTFNWIFTAGTVKDQANNSITTLTNLTTYDLVFDGSTWDIKN